MLKTRLMNAKGEYQVSGGPALLLLLGEPVSLCQGVDEALLLHPRLHPSQLPSGLQQPGPCVCFWFFKINLFIYLFIFGCVGSSLLSAGFL